MGRQSAGLLLFRDGVAGREVLLVHPGGPYWAHRDEAGWSIPKGEFEDGEDPLEAALREFREETGFPSQGPYLPLSSARQSGGKTVHAWAFRGDCDPRMLVSNTFTMEWPPKSGRQQEFPEVDRAAWFSLEEARRRIVPGQREFLDRLAALPE